MARPVTLLVGQFAQPTGIARVVRAVAGRLGSLREVHVLGVDAFSAGSAAPPCPQRPYTLHHNPYDWDVFGELALAALSQTLRPTSILLYRDLWHVPRLLRAVCDPDARVVAYCPIDGALQQPISPQGLRRLDGLAVPTAFGARMVAERLEGHPADQMLQGRTTQIPHGLDRAVFHPAHGDLPAFSQRRGAARRRLWPDQPARWQGFLVANLNRHQARKRLDLTLQGFARFATGKPPDVRLYLHWGAERTGADLRRLAQRLGLADRVVIPDRPDGVPSSALNLLYNAADVGVNTSIGEGWGLPSCEHAATGAAQIVPAHSACQELWQDAALLLPVRRIASLGGAVQGGEVGPDDLASALERLYRDQTAYERVTLSGFERAISPQWSWEQIAAQWHAWLGAIEALPPAHRADRTG